MLNFFKKTGSSPKSRRPKNDLSRSTSKSLSLSSTGSRHTESPCDSTDISPTTAPQSPTLDDEGLFDDSYDLPFTKERSRLSKTLSEVLADKSALGYFIQYVESRDVLHYVRCWLDIENFHRAVEINLRTETERKVEHDSLSVSTDGDCNSVGDFSASTLSENIKSDDDNSESNKILEDFTDDALRIFKKYVALEAAENIGCNETMRNVLVEKICSTNKSNPWEYFKEIQQFVYDILDRDYFEAFLGSDYFCKHQIDVLTSGNIVLDDILYNETALFYFMEFLEQENNRNLLEFWLAATNLQQQLYQQKEFYDPIEAQNDAVVLYDKYFSLQAHCPLGFGDKVRFSVEQTICGENGLSLDCFHLPLKLVEQLLHRNYLKSFINSQLFYKYLSELINTVQSSGYSTLYERQKQFSSDCSSEKSFCTNSTFLAMEVPRRNKDKASDMNIDSRHLYDPDSLWKRKKYRRLSFGHVTELGKFIRDVEPDPDKNGSFKLRNVMRKFVSLDEDRNKEELAWQVAEMIVKDITNVTLNEQKT